LPYQLEDGFFETVFNKPGKTYIESSGTALIAGGWLQAIKDGYLDHSYREPATKALQAVVDSLEYNKGLLSMPLISGPTIPVQLLPYLGYKLTPRTNDWEYGLASLIFAGINYQQLLDAESS
jgi:unsaturated rhamnogalacturonyl hydrolase